jgi:asparagine synthase (glutamine-hydrolysing)
MCGIAGKLYFDPNRKVSISEIKSMTDVIPHRGPDDEGHLIDNRIGLGFRRLSIIDLYSGHQPLSDNSERYWITFNGEIYNFQELKIGLQNKGYLFKTNTDTEVIINLFAEYKEKCLEYLRGMFAFVIWDKKEKLLFGARDRFGIKPFHYYIDHEKFVWGSEIKSIINCQDIDKNISLSSLDYYFAYGYSKRESTIFDKIKKLEPAQYFILNPNKKNKMEIKSYWKIQFQPDYSKSENYWKEAIYDCLNESVKLRMISDVPIGAFLSGGIDSSIVVSLMARNSTQPVKTFSIGFKEKKFSELLYARQIAEKFNTIHHEMVVEPDSIDLLPNLVSAYDEPFADSSAIPTYYVSKFTREHVTVSLSGDGGDELFAGYNSYPKMLSLNNASYSTRFTAKKIFSRLNKMIPDYFYGKGYSYYLSKNKRNIGAFFCFWKDYERRQLFNKDIGRKISVNESEDYKISLMLGESTDFLSRMLHSDMQTYMVDDILTKVDRASMLNSLETRVPLLDHKFAELSFTIPSELKLNRNSKKYILKEAFKHVLPDDIISHKKQGFSIPLSIWFKGSLKEYAYDNLTNSSKLSEILNMNYVNSILVNHQKGLREFSQKIWSLLFLNEWLNQNS